jgi:hypothetical protein
MSTPRTFALLVCALLLLGGTELSASFFHPHHSHKPNYRISHKNRSVTHLYGSNKADHYKPPKYHAHASKTRT